MILVNGTAADSVAATDRGLAYGDGAFRTLPVRRGRAQCWPLHHGKLAHDCAALAIECPPADVLHREIGLLARERADCAVKIIVTRGSGARGYAPPRPSSPTRIVMGAALPVYPEDFRRSGVAVHLCATRLSLQPRLAGVKHLNRLENVIARAEWDDPAVPEGLMLDAQDRVIGGTMSNLFVIENGLPLTPDLSSCGVAGVTRDRVMRAATREGVACREASITRERLLDAEEALLVNSLIGVWQIRTCAGRTWAPGAFTARVRKWLDEDVG